MRRASSTRWLANAALATVSLALAILAAEVWLRWQNVLPDYWNWHKTLVILDPQVLYRIKGHSRHDINAYGYRDYEFDRDKGDRRRVLMVGDSFVFGDNVRPDQTMPKVLERLLGDGWEVFNMGSPGDGPDQTYARLMRDGLSFDPDVVVLAIYPGNDFNDLVKNRLYVLDEEGEAVFNDHNPVAEALPLFRLGILIRKLFTGRGLDPEVQGELNQILGYDVVTFLENPESGPDAEKVRLMAALLRRFEHTVAEAGADLHVVIIPSVHGVQHPGLFRRRDVAPEHWFDTERTAMELCEREGLSCLNLTLPFLAHADEGLYDSRDGHLSPRGNELAAESIQMLLTPP